MISDYKLDDEVKERVKNYHIINNVVFVLALIGAATVSYYAAQVPVESLYSTRLELDNGLFYSIFLGLASLYGLLYMFIRVTIKNYGESIKNNLYNKRILDAVTKE